MLDCASFSVELSQIRTLWILSDRQGPLLDRGLISFPTPSINPIVALPLFLYPGKHVRFLKLAHGPLLDRSCQKQIFLVLLFIYGLQ